jgi:hypothetical protein
MDTEETLSASPNFEASTVKTRRGREAIEQPAAIDDDERPRRRRASRRADKANNRLFLGLAIGGGAMLILAVGIVIVVILSRSSGVVAESEKKTPPPKATKAPATPSPVDEQPQKQEPPKPGNVQFPIWRTQSAQRLSQLAKAMHIFHDSNGSFPYAKSAGGTKKGQLSWRVAILPFIDQVPLYKKFKLDEPWDSPHNKRVLDEEAMPRVFASPADNVGEENKTYYQIITGPQTAWPNDDSRPRMPGSYPKGASNTYLIVEGQTPVFWTQPENIVFDGGTVPPLGGIFNGDFHAAMADASVHYIIRGEVSDNAIRASITAK